MSTRARWLILALALAGLAFATSSAWVHYRLLTDPTYVSPCDINATFNCSQVYLSQYGAVGGVPVALGGVIWFALVLLVAGLSRPTVDEASPVGGYLFAISTVGLAVILYLGYASFMVLRTGCLLCIGTYVSVIGIFIVSGTSSRSVALSRLPGRLMSDLTSITRQPATLLAAVLFLAGAASVVAFFPKEGSRPAQSVVAPEADQITAFRQAWDAQPRIDLGIPAEGAKALVVKFVDWQCPSCKAAYFAYKPVFDRYAESHPGAVREVVKDYPLSSRCNYFIQGEAHIAACEEAAAVRMARERGKGQTMIDWLFSVPAQQQLQPDAVKAQTAQIIGETGFDWDAEYAKHIEAVRRDVADGGALQVNSTPTYFINGVRAQTPTGWLPPEYFELAIKIELEKAGVH